MYESDTSEGRKPRPFGVYEPTRKPRLRPVAAEPPPLPPATPEFDGDRFGDAPEDGLRMLAALETLTSLEPDFCDDLTAEASVTIIERVGHDPHEADAGSLRERLHAVSNREDMDDESAPFCTLAAEAVVEIVEIGDVAAEPVEEPPQVVGERRRGRTTSRFFKALSGGR